MLPEFRAVLHRREGFIKLKTIHPLRCRIRDYRYSVIPNHRVSLVCREFPHGQASALFVLREECLDEVARAFAIDDGVERVRRAKCVPEREDRVIRKTVSDM